jgi:calcineurin-like phosphoesterase family protein
MTTYFTSDLHFGHANVIKYSNRPFASVQAMDEALIANWNSVVTQHDEVWLLGDVFFHQVDTAKRILRRLNGSIHLVYGNHDKVIMKDPELQGMFASVTHGIKEIDRVVDGEKHRLVLCHYPLLSWNRAHHGSLMLFGHAHGSIPFDNTYRRQDVGVDVWGYTPVSLRTLVNKLTKIPGRDYRGR